jgi:hypothetical protein
MSKFAKCLIGALAVVAAGCGGSGGGTGGGTNVAFFMTDDLHAGYDHVWVTVKEVTLQKVGGGFTTVYADPTGVAVDLRSLRDASGRRFKFLGCDDDLSGQYTSVIVTLDDDVVLFPTGATTGLNRVFDGSVGGEKTLSANFPAQTFGEDNDDFVIDFDLSTWNENGSLVTDASIKVLSETDEDELEDGDRHERDDYEGVVSNLSGTPPDQTFTLTHDGSSVEVQLNANTEIDEDDDEGPLDLTNGAKVEVEGYFDPVLNKLVASKLEVEDSEDNDNEPEVQGNSLAVDAGAFSFDIDVDETDHFVPEGDPVHIATTGTTLFRLGNDQWVSREVFFGAFTNGTKVEVEGNYDPGTNTLTATKVKIEGEDD